METLAIPSLSIARYGAATGARLVYFHGTPGAPVEAAWWHAAAMAQGVQVWSPQRYALNPALQGPAYFAALAQALQAELAACAKPTPVFLVGFSLGGFAALQTALALQKLGVPLAGLHLVSAAAPLEAGDFLPHMAGQAVFRMAQERPGLLRTASAVQGWLARVWPMGLQRMLFSSAQASDRALASDTAFQATLRTVLQEALGQGRPGYLRELQAYVKPWSTTVAQLQVPAWVWHGEQDNWSPPGMAHWLHAHLPQAQGIQMLPGQSHYGCLLAAIAPVCAQAGAAEKTD